MENSNNFSKRIIVFGSPATAIQHSVSKAGLARREEKLKYVSFCYLLFTGENYNNNSGLFHHSSAPETMAECFRPESIRMEESSQVFRMSFFVFWSDGETARNWSQAFILADFSFLGTGRGVADRGSSWLCSRYTISWNILLYILNFLEYQRNKGFFISDSNAAAYCFWSLEPVLNFSKQNLFIC